MGQQLTIPAPRAGQARLAALHEVIPKSAEALFHSPTVLPGHLRIAEAAVAHFKQDPANAAQLHIAETLLAVLRDEQKVEPILAALRAAHAAGALSASTTNHLTQQAVNHGGLGVADLMATGVDHDKTQTLSRAQRRALDAIKDHALAAGAKATQFFDPVVFVQTVFSPATDDQVKTLNRAAGANVPLRDTISALLRVGLAYGLAQTMGGQDYATTAVLACASTSAALLAVFKLDAAIIGAGEAYNRSITGPAAR